MNEADESGEFRDEEGGQTLFEQAKASARKQYDGRDLKSLVEVMNGFRLKKADLEQKLAECNAYYDVLRMEKVPERMELDGVERVSYEGIGRVALTADLFVRTRDKVGLFGWLRKNKLSDLIQPGVNPSTLKSFIKKRMQAGKPVPNDFVVVTPITRASITKA